MKPSIAIISECQSKNLGDQAIALSLAAILDPYYETSFSSFGRISDGKFNESAAAAVPRTGLRRVLRFLPAVFKARIIWYLLGEKRKFRNHFGKSISGSALIIVGGGQLVKNNIDLFCEKLALVDKISSDRAVPLSLIGVGVDGRMSAMTWLVARKALSNARVLMLRDSISRARIEERRGSHHKILTVPDLVFSLPVPASNRDVSERNISLAVNVMSFKVMLGQAAREVSISEADILIGMCRIVRAVRDVGLTVSLFTSGSDEDLRAANEVRSELIKLGTRVKVFHPSTLRDLETFLCDANHVIACRMHAGILAYVAGCNPLCINWDDKINGVWSEIGQSDRVVNMVDIACEDIGSILIRRLQSLGPASISSLDCLAMQIRSSVLDEVQGIVEGSSCYQA